MVNTRSDEIQALTERKIETKCITAVQSDRVLKKLLKLFLQKSKKLFKKKLKKLHVFAHCANLSVACEKPEAADCNTPPKM